MPKILPSDFKDQVFCFEKQNTNWSDYFLVPDLPTVSPPIPFRPTWKGVGRTPNQAPASLVEVQARTRNSLATDGFLPHTGEYKHYANSVNYESSLRNLDMRLTNRAFGQRVIGELNHPSHDGLTLLTNYRDKSYQPYTQIYSAECSFERKYDNDHEMNSANFNNSTRATTQNLRLPHMKIASRPPLQNGRPGYINSKV